ncbi:MAG: hypothetical protein LBK63_03620 [Treponema sp.]|jgi:hypothetical protein|nr:hypothetical protein [Treponema sp.]
MKRFVVVTVVFLAVLGAAHGQNINKAQYKAISLADYVAAGNVKERTDTELFKMDFKFLLQAANSVAVQDAEDAMHRFISEKKLDFERGAALVLYIRSTHSVEGFWETELIDLAELRAGS